MEAHERSGAKGVEVRGQQTLGREGEEGVAEEVDVCVDCIDCVNEVDLAIEKCNVRKMYLYLMTVIFYHGSFRTTPR